MRASAAFRQERDHRHVCRRALSSSVQCRNEETRCIARSAFCSWERVEGGSGHSGRGESCWRRNDCKSGLACINGVCTLNDFEIETTAKPCDLIECTVDANFCDEPSSYCDDLASNCELGYAYACSQYNSECVCRAGCSENRCVFRCSRDSDCLVGTCVDGGCVQCSRDGDCSGDRVCDSGTCVAGCSSNRDCPYLHTCRNGRCIETGCTTDRECIALSDNPRALCDQGECTIPCENDAECNLGGYRFQDCIEGRCVYVDCETDEECRIFLDIRPGSNSTAVCHP